MILLDLLEFSGVIPHWVGWRNSSNNSSCSIRWVVWLLSPHDPENDDSSNVPTSLVQNTVRLYYMSPNLHCLLCEQSFCPCSFNTPACLSQIVIFLFISLNLFSSQLVLCLWFHWECQFREISSRRLPRRIRGPTFSEPFWVMFPPPLSCSTFIKTITMKRNKFSVFLLGWGTLYPDHSLIASGMVQMVVSPILEAFALTDSGLPLRWSGTSSLSSVPYFSDVPCRGNTWAATVSTIIVHVSGLGTTHPGCGLLCLPHPVPSSQLSSGVADSEWW